ncbi:hypothetical protein [Deinococcus aquaedulcis]|uniref:hypothetical protein n=1 Tax=Deinococcus aquaedulcis TaxID=2840455 RepID=UPI001C82CCEB|nr:hypothetical protein [Deinococcus aquaedulcis]
MFWKKKKFEVAPPFLGSAFDLAVDYCQRHEVVKHLDASEIHVQLGRHIICIYKGHDHSWLNAKAKLAPDNLDVAQREKYLNLTKVQFENITAILDHEGSGLTARYHQMMRYQGKPEMHVFNMLSTFDYLLNKDDSRLYPPEEVRFVCDGRSFDNASEALVHYMKHVRRCRVREVQPEYIAFDTAGAYAIVGLKHLSHEFSIRYGFSDFVPLIEKSKHSLTPHYFAAAYRKAPLPTASYCFDDGVSELAISGTLTAGTEARPIFTATLSALYQVLLDSTERIKMNPDLLTGKQQLHSEEESIQQARKYEGDKTGGVEFLSDA